jgi:hypothetical protein
MSNRFYASLLYIALIVASSWTVVTIGEALAREALTKLALAPSSERRPTRVNAVLASQKTIVSPSRARDVIVPKAPSIAFGDLAKGLDEAEQNNKQSKTMGVVVRPRVAGWVKRINKRAIAEEQPRRAVSEDTSGRIIMRSLRAEM